MGASSSMTKYDNEWDTVVTDPSLVSALPFSRSDLFCPIPYQIGSMSYFSVLLDRNLQQRMIRETSGSSLQVLQRTRTAKRNDKSLDGDFLRRVEIPHYASMLHFFLTRTVMKRHEQVKEVEQQSKLHLQGVCQSITNAQSG